MNYENIVRKAAKVSIKIKSHKFLFGLKSGKLLGFIVSNQGISQLMVTCEPISQLLKNKNIKVWNNDCQEAFEKIKKYL
jgi:hypothetical protein